MTGLNNGQPGAMWSIGSYGELSKKSKIYGSVHDPRQHGEEQQRERQRELERGPGAKCTFQQPTELVGGRVWRPYVPLGIGRIGEGGGMVEIQNHHQSIVS